MLLVSSTLTPMTQPQAGWYPSEGSERWWDGEQWTEHTRPVIAAPTPEPAPSLPDGGLLAFSSHIAGKNAKVVIYPDRLEWTRSGLSTLGRSSSEVVPIRSITSVSSKRGGIARTVVQLVTSGGKKIDLHVGNKDVEPVKDLLRSLIV